MKNDESAFGRWRLGAVAILCAVAVTACSQDATPTGGDSDVRVVQHAFGETSVPTDPTRVAVLDGDRTMEAVVALGVEPVAAVKPPLTGDYAPVVRARLAAEPTDIGSADVEVNVEALIATAPDLIVMRTSGEDNRDLYDQVSAVAPTVVVEYTPASWQSTLEQVAGFLDEEERADSLIADYQRVVDESSARAPQEGRTLTVARVRADALRYMTQDGSFPYSVLADLGYRAPEQQDRGSDAVQTVDVSPELIDVLAADDIVLLTDAGTEDAVAQLRQNPLFTALGARVTELPSKDFLFGNVLTAQALVETASEIGE
ncbi:ABC transporter substrate-binding protein [Rhodococcus sp. P1Y]|uniref:ABC transporter substrate-binding protein n=1 Tax=Rhodococcus sp. P1Y TaxID=1302308 RepID=UPI0012939FE5|nr:ABC transporter substrate-binding protein [Rhodococcus sp. P1Y]